jgi:hypothetical protein
VKKGQDISFLTVSIYSVFCFENLTVKAERKGGARYYFQLRPRLYHCMEPLVTAVIVKRNSMR